MKKIFVFLLFIFMAILSVYFYIEKDKEKTDRSTATMPSEKVEKKKYPANKIKENYGIDKEQFISMFTTSNTSHKSFEGTLNTYYVEDLYKEARVIDSTWQIKAIHKEKETWEIQLYENQFDSITLEGVLGKDTFTIKDMPVLDGKDLILTSDSQFAFEEKKKMLTEYFATVQKRILTNPYMSVPVAELENKLENLLSEYPKNSNGTTDIDARTSVYVHYQYLTELSNRINITFKNSENKIKNIETYLKTNSPKSDAHFEEKAQQLFAELNSLQSDNEKLTTLYNDKATYYAFPDDKNEDFQTKDQKTIDLIDKIVAEFSLSKVATFNQKAEKLANESNKQYTLYTNRLNQR